MGDRSPVAARPQKERRYRFSPFSPLGSKCVRQNGFGKFISAKTTRPEQLPAVNRTHLKNLHEPGAGGEHGVGFLGRPLCDSRVMGTRPPSCSPRTPGASFGEASSCVWQFPSLGMPVFKPGWGSREGAPYRRSLRESALANSIFQRKSMQLAINEAKPETITGTPGLFLCSLKV